MKLPNWFKIVWWLLLLAACSVYLGRRYTLIESGGINRIDTFAVVLWIGLALAPVFVEFSLFGLSLKQEIESVKQELRSQAISLRADVQSAVSVNNNLNQHFVLPAPPADSELPGLKEQVQAAVAATLRDKGIAVESGSPELPSDLDTIYLFQVRLAIEIELRRLWENHIGEASPRRVTPAFRTASQLVAAEILQPQLADAIRELYAICSPAIHGQGVSKAQVGFAKDVAPEVIRTLQRLA